ncbi:MAG: class I SAM-dependent methyltransferase [Chloroflexota bacterium]
MTVRARIGQPDIYRAPFLAVYDWFVLGFMNHVMWRCPTRTLLAQYDAYVSAHHLDVGVGTGYYLDQCQFPTLSPSLTLLDVSPSPLKWAARRLSRYEPRLHATSVLEPIDLAGERFDSIGLNYVVHCLPGRFPAKAAAFRNLRPLLRPGGVLFGATMLGKGVHRHLPAECFFRASNMLRVFGNRHDDLGALKQALTEQFSQVEIRVVGCMALFVAHLDGEGARILERDGGGERTTSR